jgi:hypothetical protein
MPGDRRQILSLLRLPIPPLQRILFSMTYVTQLQLRLQSGKDWFPELAKCFTLPAFIPLGKDHRRAAFQNGARRAVGYPGARAENPRTRHGFHLAKAEDRFQMSLHSTFPRFRVPNTCPVWNLLRIFLPFQTRESLARLVYQRKAPASRHSSSWTPPTQPMRGVR